MISATKNVQSQNIGANTFLLGILETIVVLRHLSKKNVSLTL